MAAQEFVFKAHDGKDIHAYRWLPVNEALAVVQIVHGMAEHASRYNDFAEFLNKAGIAVYACDLRGHGTTAGSTGQCGYFADKDGWMRVTSDVQELTLTIKKAHPFKAVFLLGHSMGSFVSRTYIALFGNEINGCILSGTASHPALLLSAAGFIASLQKTFLGKHHPSKLLDKLSFGAYNKNIPNPRTPFDWLSHDPDIVDGYVSDPYCGFICTAGFFSDLFRGLKFINKKINIDKTPQLLPMYFICGAEDPVGNYSAGVIKAFELYKQSGVKDISLKIYDRGRHEMLNETNKEMVYADVLEWIKKHLDLSYSKNND
jgi:alpha-beta hydrolase superfamily lysophospholipase